MNLKVNNKGWVVVKVGEVGTLIRGITYNKAEAASTPLENFKPVLRGNNINTDLNFENLVYVPNKLISSEQLINEGDIIFAMSSGSKHLVGKSARARSNFDGSYGAFCALLRPCKQINKDYLYYVFQANNFRRLISEIAKGSNINNLKREHILDFEFELPPLNEQHRIVAKIEELFSELDQGISELKTAQAQLKIYRQALLKHAFEGKLTTEWRSQNAEKLEGANSLQQRIQHAREQRYQQKLASWQVDKKQNSKPKAPKPITPLTAEELPELPQGWIFTVFELIGDWSGGGTPSKAVPEYWNNANIPWVSPKDMKSNFIHQTQDCITVLGVMNSPAKLVDPGSLLFVVRSGILRRTLPLAVNKVTVTLNQDMQAITPHIVLPEYLLYFCMGAEFDIRQSCAKDGTTVESVDINSLKNYLVPVCSEEEQKLIVQKVESKLLAIEQLEQTITTSLQQAEALRQSILKKAFSGELAAQNIEDEPASQLLERIRAEKAPQRTFITKTNSKKATLQKNNVVPFPVKVPAIDTTELHAGLMALAYRCHEQHKKSWYFGHVKAEKISHMIESFIGIDLERVPIQDAAGPNDFKRLLEVESLARQKQWFDIRKQSNGRYFLVKLSGFDALIQRTEWVLGTQLESVNALIDLFLPLNKTRSEIVATLYAAWNNLLLSGHKPSDDEIVLEARDRWHVDKLKIRKERFSRCLIWMRQHGLTPHGRGMYVAKKNLKNVPRGQHD
jgi:type I restriction enzyme, S subunit